MEMSEETKKRAKERKRCPYIPYHKKEQGLFCLNGWSIPHSACTFQKDMCMSSHGVILLIYFLQRERLNKTPKKSNNNSKPNKNQNSSLKQGLQKLHPECLHSLSILIQNLINLRVLMEILLTHTLYKSGTKNVRRKTNIYLYYQLIKPECLPGTALYFPQASAAMSWGIVQTQPLWWHTQSFMWFKGMRLTWTLLLTQYGDESCRLQSWTTDFLRNVLRMRKMQKMFINYTKSHERLPRFLSLTFFSLKDKVSF